MARIKMPAARSTAKEITFEEAFALGRLIVKSSWTLE